MTFEFLGFGCELLHVRLSGHKNQARVFMTRQKNKTDLALRAIMVEMDATAHPLPTASRGIPSRLSFARLHTCIHVRGNIHVCELCCKYMCLYVYIQTHTLQQGDDPAPERSKRTESHLYRQ